VRGADRHGRFVLEPDPRNLTADERVAAHHRAYALYREGYEEQMALHQRAFA
jgi:hypothetical protein